MLSEHLLRTHIPACPPLAPRPCTHLFCFLLFVFVDGTEHIYVSPNIPTVVEHIQAVFCYAYWFTGGYNGGSCLIIHHLSIPSEFIDQGNIHLPPITKVVRILKLFGDRLDCPGFSFLLKTLHLPEGT